MDDRLKLLYAEAMRAAHTSAFVSVHIGTDVRDYLRGFMPPKDFGPGATCWGFPVVVESELRSDHMSVHTITRIP